MPLTETPSHEEFHDGGPHAVTRLCLSEAHNARLTHSFETSSMCRCWYREALTCLRPRGILTGFPTHSVTARPPRGHQRTTGSQRRLAERHLTATPLQEELRNGCHTRGDQARPQRGRPRAADSHSYAGKQTAGAESPTCSALHPGSRRNLLRHRRLADPRASSDAKTPRPCFSILD